MQRATRMSNSNRRLLFLVNPLKGTMTGTEVAAACDAAARAEGVPADVIPVSDGGDGLLDACVAARLLSRVSSHRVSGPVGRPVEARVGWLDGHTAVIESSEVIGVRLLETGERDPLRTDTGGLGELVAAALEEGATSMLIGVGGSSTMDGGLGMARHWGWYGLDRTGRPLGTGGGELARLTSLHFGWHPACRIAGLVDVTNPLLGANGARVYARQKGARAAEEDRLVRGLENLVAATAAVGGAEVGERSGAGAGGGLGFGLVLFGGATLAAGADWMLQSIHLEERLHGVSGVVTAEGTFDGTSVSGKLTGRVIDVARQHGIPAGLLAPRVSEKLEGVVVETGGGTWNRANLEERARALIRRMTRLPPS